MPLFATVQPGVTVTNTTALTSSILNRLGTPTVDIVGEVDGTGSVTIADGTIANAKLVNMTGPTVKGIRTGTGVPVDVAVDDLTLEIGNSGANGTLRVFAGGILTANLATASSATTGVTYAKMQQVTAARLIGNPTASLAAPSEITLGTGLAFSGTSLLVSLAAGVIGAKSAKSTYVHDFATGDTPSNARAIGGSAFTWAQGRVILATDGVAEFSLTYTPVSASSCLIVEATVPVQMVSNGATVCLALFQDASGTDAAINVGVSANSSNAIVLTSMRSYLLSSTTTARTFKLRIATAGYPDVTSASDVRMIVNGYNNSGTATACFGSSAMHVVLSVTEMPV